MRAKRAMVTFFNEQKFIKNGKNLKLAVKQCYQKGLLNDQKIPKFKHNFFE